MADRPALERDEQCEECVGSPFRALVVMRPGYFGKAGVDVGGTILVDHKIGDAERKAAELWLADLLGFGQG